MQILILNGSPRAGGNTQRLIQAFSEGAASIWNNVRCFDTAQMEIAPCSACYHCRSAENEGRCRVPDDMTAIHAAMAQADVLVLATPLYYFGFSAQLKKVIDRFFAINGSLKRDENSEGGLKRMVLLAVCGDKEEQAMNGLLENYRLICAYLGIENAGEILATGVYDIGDIEGHAALKKARRLAAELEVRS